MRFMNEYEVNEAGARYQDHAVLGPATRTLANLVDWTNSHSDGWAHWSKPIRAAARLQDLIMRGDRWDEDREDATAAEYAAAVRPLKAFRTRQGADFTIEAIGGTDNA